MEKNNSDSLTASSSSILSSSSNTGESSLPAVIPKPPPGKQPRPTAQNGLPPRETPSKIEDLKEEDLNYSDLKTEVTSSVCFVGRRIVREYKSEFILPNDMRIAVSRKETLIPGAGIIEVFVDLSHAVPDYFDELVFESQCIENFIAEDEWATGMLISDSTKEGDLLRQLEEGCKDEPELYTIERIERRKNREQIVSIRNDPVIRNIHVFKDDPERDTQSRPTSVTSLDDYDLTPTDEVKRLPEHSIEPTSSNNPLNGVLSTECPNVIIVSEDPQTHSDGEKQAQEKQIEQNMPTSISASSFDRPPPLPMSVMTHTFEKAFSNCSNVTTLKISDTPEQGQLAIEESSENAVKDKTKKKNGSSK